ncbi:MAG: hypothetical protein U0930_24470 [Pirellulales bacterium]
MTCNRTVTGSVPLNASAAPEGLELSVYEIDNNPFQPRRKFNQEEIASLAAPTFASMSSCSRFWFRKSVDVIN